MSTMTSPQQARQDRQIRVFISSTFKDMKEERDYLVKFTFPQLRKLCESRGVVWGEVDLRWGVPDEAVAEGKVLPICLEEIKRCRPYFIGLLGERYGWIPDAIPCGIVEREPWLAEHVHGRKSVTELEILHGVLNNPDMAEHAFFYFRDPAYVESLPTDKRRDFTAEDAEDAGRLRKLKDRIRKSGFPVRENYPDPKALGELVLADLTAVIGERFPEGSQPDPLDREAMDHDAYAQSRERVYIGRPEYFAKLDVHADGTGDQPLVILGESGCGKSALLANWVAHYRQVHPDTLILQHYIGATPYSADWAAMLRRLMGEFKRRMEIREDIPDKPDALRIAFPSWLHMAAAKDRIVLVLDALNQLEDRDGAPDLVWLPPVMPESLRLIVSTLPGRSLDEINKRAWPVLKVEPLSQSERERLITEYLAQSAKALSPDREERIAAAPQSANPLYLRVLLDELRLFGEHERLDERINHYLQAQSPRELYRKVIARWKEDYGKGTPLVGNTLALLWAARRGLSETERLYALSKDGRPLARAIWSPLFLAMSDALVSRGGLLTFAHDFLRMAAQDAYLPTKEQQRQAHLSLADYFQRQPPSARRTDELPWQLAQARAWERLQMLLTDRAFCVEAWNHNQFDVKTYWAQIETGSALRVVDVFRRLIEHPEEEEDKGYLWGVAALLADIGHPGESLRLQSVLVDHFRATGDLNNLQVTLGRQAIILYTRGDLDGAMALLKDEEGICRRLGDLDGLQASLGNQGNVLYFRGDLDDAMALQKETERLCRQLGNLDGLQVTLGNQAGILYARGNLDGAMALHKEQEQICRQLGNLHSLQANLGNQALILGEWGHLDSAVAVLTEAEQICRQLGNLDGLLHSLGNLALILMDRGDLSGARILLQEVEHICRQLHNLEGLASSLINQSLVLCKMGRPQAGLPLAEQAYQIATDHGYTMLAKQSIEPVLNRVRQAARGS
jgi:nephrocystin-3